MSYRPQKGLTDEQYLAAYDKVGTISGAAALLGVHKRTFERRLERIRAGRTIDQTRTLEFQQRDDEVFKGRSVLWNPATGEHKLEWYKTDRDKQAQFEAMKQAVQALSDEIPAIPAIRKPKVPANDLLNLHVLTDAHIGMLAWGEETGEDWDTELAEELLLNYFAAAIEKAPQAHRGVLAQMGDFLHYDGIDAVTPASGHQLDTDTRFAKLVRTGIRITRQLIEMMLSRYVSVEVIMAEGNHDPVSEIWLREQFADRYRNQPRLFIDQSPKPFYCIEHGDTSLFFHHGHLKKIEQIDRALAAEFRELFGRTKHSYAHLGHLHHYAGKETELMTVEQHNTLAARDAYASRHMYKATRRAKVITYHATHGYVGELAITPEMLA